MVSGRTTGTRLHAHARARTALAPPTTMILGAHGTLHVQDCRAPRYRLYATTRRALHTCATTYHLPAYPPAYLPTAYLLLLPPLRAHRTTPATAPLRTTLHRAAAMPAYRLRLPAHLPPLRRWTRLPVAQSIACAHTAYTAIANACWLPAISLRSRR